MRSFGFAAIVFGNLAMIHATRSRDRVIFERAALGPTRRCGGSPPARSPRSRLRSMSPPIADIFRFAPLSAGHLAIAAAAGIVGVLWYEVYKVLRPRSIRV